MKFLMKESMLKFFLHMDTMSNFWLQNINIMRQVGGMRRLGRLGVVRLVGLVGLVRLVGRVRLVGGMRRLRMVRLEGVDRLGLDCKNVEKVRN